MTTPTQSSDNTVLALVPPQIPSGTIPVEGAIYGIPLRIYDLDPMGLQVRVLSYLGQQKNDTIWLNLNGQLRIVSGQTQSDSDDVTLHIPHQQLLPNRVNELTYTVTRNSENLATSTPALTLLYNEIRPGNEDLTPGDRQHSELELLLPDALKNGVGPDFVSATVCVRYPYCRAYDQIRLNCNGYDVFYTVTTNDAPGPPNPGSSTPTTVCFTVTRADLERAQDHPQFSISFTVTDQHLNTADPESLFSAVQTVDVDLAGTRLPKAILLENLDDYPGDDPSLIEREKLGNQQLSVYVKTDDSRIQVDDRIEAVYTATSNGQPDIVVMVSGTVEGKLGQKLPCVLEVANDKVISGYSVAVAYKVFRGATLIGESRVAYAKVVGEKTIDTAAPKLVAPATNPVEPLRYPSGVLVQVTFALALPGDKAQLFLFNPAPGSQVFPILSLAQTFAIFTLDALFLGQWHGKAPQLGWKLIREGKVIAESPALVLTVLPIFSGDERLPIPTLAGKAGSDLDVLQLTTKDLFELKQWPLQALGQVVWLRYDGFLDNGAGTSAEFVIWGGLPHNYPPSDLATPLTAALIAWLKTLKVGSKITVTFEVNFDKVRNAVTKVTFPLRVYTVRAVLITPPAPTVEEASGKTLDPIAAKDHLTVVVQYPDMRSSDKISVIWSGTAGGGSHTSSPVEVGVVGIKKIPIPITVVALNLGRLVAVSYIVIRDGVSTSSLILQLTVGTIKNEDDRLPTPKILQAANAGDGPELDVSKLTAGATVRCLVWPLIAFGQPVWLHLRGKNVSGGEHNITLLQHPNNAVHQAWLNAGYYNASVLYSYLKDLGDGSVLEVWFTAALDMGTDESKAVRFPVRRYTVRAVLMTPPAPTVEEASGNILDPIAAKDLLTVVVPSYPGMRSSDKISVIWSGTAGGGSHTSSPVEVGVVGIKKIPIPITVVALNLGRLVAVSYIVIRDGVSTPSLILQLTVGTIKNEDDRLPTPKILQAANAGDGPELDVSKLTAGATVRCLVWPLIAFGQPVWLHLRGKNVSGGEHNITLLQHPNNAVHYAWLNAGYYNASVLYSYLKDLGDGSVLEVWFTAALDMGTDESKAVKFPVRRYTVRAVLMTPPAPTVEEASGNILDPIAAKDLLTVVVPSYPGMRSSDKISVIWSGTAGGGSHTSSPVEVGVVGIKKIPIPITVVALNLGRLVAVSYIVIRDGVSTPSLILQLTVGTIKNEDDRLPTPRILQAANAGDGPELDVSKLTAGATVRCLVWPLIEFGQPVWLHLRGKNASGGEHNITLLQHPTNAVHQAWLNAGYYNASVLYSYLKDLGDGSVLEVWFTAALDKGTDESKAVRFPVRRYAVKALVDEKPTITVKDSKGVEIPNGGTTADTNVTLTGTASKGKTVEAFDGAVSIGKPNADTNTAIWTLPVTGLSRDAHSFIAKALYGSGQTSEARTLIVDSPLYIDPSNLAITGRNISLQGSGIGGLWARYPQRPADTMAHRPATGGTGPYTYRSSNSNIASTQDAWVHSEGNGTATITVTDAKNATAQYTVTVTGVKYLRYNPTPASVTQYPAWVSSVGGQPMTHQDPYATRMSNLWVNVSMPKYDRRFALVLAVTSYSRYPDNPNYIELHGFYAAYSVIAVWGGASIDHSPLPFIALHDRP